MSILAGVRQQASLNILPPTPKTKQDEPPSHTPVDALSVRLESSELINELGTNLAQAHFLVCL
ncbi:hypothetical protein P6709_19845 [Jeotgalibacillus sp. ET6]|uniref:hypothetical protein n=1 Tax=Jeotgalibacillus sp. ET6 TaxID=3037260 RepID=UPI002418540F|nr:hypothetical protein [Jeotgalibacillus sp. ET6]MDG5473966.1 hypothetical protein [Jeotgalibacillus sp. ET6]